VTATSETGRPELVIALNGTIAATTWTYGDNASVGRFTAALPERLFRNGANRLDVLQLVSGPGGTILHPVQIEHEDRKINLGQALDFRRGRLDDRYLIGGLARPEKEYTWSNAVFVQFEFEVRDARGDIVLHAQVAPYLANGLIPEQVIDIRVDGEPVGAWVLDQPELGEQTIVIPERLITGGNFLLEFRIPRAAEPRVLGQGEDRRLLGLQFRSLWFSSDAD
jgi:hypothetical protein